MEAEEREETAEEESGHAEHEQPLVADRGHAEVEDSGELGRHPEIVAAREGEQARLEERGETEGEHEIEGALRPSAEPATKMPAIVIA